MPHLSPLYRFSDGFVCCFRSWPNFFAVIRFWMIFSSVVRFLIHPNVPLMEQLGEKLGVQKTSFSNMNKARSGYFVGEISNTSLVSDLTTKIGDKALFILRN